MADTAMVVLDEEKQTAALTSPTLPEHCGRTINEWLMFGLDMLGLAMALVACLNIDECPGIPGLTACCLSFGLIGVLTGMIRFIHRTESTKSNPTCANHATSVLGISLIGVSVWGAVLTLPEASRFGHDSSDCPNIVFNMGFFGFSACILIVSLFLLGAIAKSLFRSGTAPVAEGIER